MSNDTRVLNVERSTSTAHRLTHYEGACGNVHGHNMKWEVEAEIDMSDAGEDNMPVDLKDISGVIDETDHAILLNDDDPLLKARGALGDVITFEGDPTCELVSMWMAKKLVRELEPVAAARVKISETEKYSIRSNWNQWKDDEEDA